MIFYEKNPEEVINCLEYFQIIDVREEAEFDEYSPLDGCSHIPLDNLRDNMSALESVPEGVPILVVCRSGRRSLRATYMLKSYGLKKVYSLNGGLKTLQCLIDADQ